MAHLIEIRDGVPSIYLVGQPAWHRLGTPVEEAKTSKDVLTMCGADWNVIQQPIYVKIGDNFVQVEENFANMRDIDNKILGVVGGRYKILQNAEAFDFTDALVSGSNTLYESAGVLRSGRRIWILARLPKENILGDVITPYICFTTTHDGTGGVKVAMTPIRVVCQNTLTMALTGSPRVWMARHTESIADKMYEAQRTLGLASEYMKALGEHADILQQKKVNRDILDSFMEEIFPLPKEEGRKFNNVLQLRNTFAILYNTKTDLHKFGDSAWKVMGAMSDLVTHIEPQRETATARENKFMKIVDGHDLMENAERFLLKVA